MSDELRTVQRLVDNEWITVRMSELQPGDTMRMLEPSGEIVLGRDGETTFCVVAPPWNDDGTWTVMTETISDVLGTPE